MKTLLVSLLLVAFAWSAQAASTQTIGLASPTTVAAHTTNTTLQASQLVDNKWPTGPTYFRVTVAAQGDAAATNGNFVVYVVPLADGVNADTWNASSTPIRVIIPMAGTNVVRNGELSVLAGVRAIAVGAAINTTGGIVTNTSVLVTYGNP